MNRILLLATAAALTCSATATAQHADSLNGAAKVLLEREDYVAAVPALREAAEAGHPEAQYNLGWALIEGAGTVADPVEANRWLRSAAEQGWVDAQFKLGYSYALGRGTEQNMTKAFRWFETAAENGDAEAQFFIIGMLMEGQGVEVDLGRALEWAERLAVQETPEDLRISGTITNARLNLARMYLNGERGVERDPLEAYMWLLIANENKIDLSVLVQQQMIRDVQALQEELESAEQEQARQEAVTMLGRPLTNLVNLHEQEI
ncbi:MAG: tetratricopeptide repeat protein [Rhodothermales bacterium]